jgi:hypothetical protein
VQRFKGNDVTKLTPKQQEIMAAYQATGRVAILYPRKGTIALNGFPQKPIKEAMAQMQATLEREAGA